MPQCDPGTDDRGAGWRGVNVPHDFMVEGVFSGANDISQGFLPYGVGWYRKHFTLPAGVAKDSVVWVDFEGVMISSQVYLNGRFLGNHTGGYTPFRFRLDGHALHWGAGADNVLAVRVSEKKPNIHPNGRCHSGFDHFFSLTTRTP